MTPPTLTPDLEAFADALVASGYDALLVGGAVRDALLGRPTGDLDVVTNATPDDVRTVADGEPWARSTYSLGERFGTLGVVLADGVAVEVTRYRDVALDGATTSERFATDALHRDFTVNAMAVDLAARKLLDPLGGQSDLAVGVLRAPGPASERLAEDPLRVLRTARFVAELGFEVDSATGAAMPPAAPRLSEVAVERVRDELNKLLVAPHAPRGLGLLRDCGALTAVLPEIAALDGVTQPSFHDLDVLAHTIQATGLVRPTLVLRWATLLHDVGKAPARTVESDGRIRFFRHAKLGAEIAERVCRRLRLSNAETAAIVHLVAEHMRLGETAFDNPRAVDRAVRKLDLPVASAHPPRMLVTAEDAAELVIADFGATARRADAGRLRKQLECAIAESRERGSARKATSAMSGSDLMVELEMSAGREIGDAKRTIEAAIERGDLAPDDRAGALEIARRSLGYHLDTQHRESDEKEATDE
jgi:poly(A) polymerase